MSLRVRRAIASVVMFAASGTFFKLFILDKGPLEEMGVRAPTFVTFVTVVAVITIVIFAGFGVLLAWLAITKPDRPSYGYGVPGQWYVIDVMPVIRKPTFAFTLWTVNITLLLMSSRGGNLEPPPITHTTVYRIRVKHSASSDIATWEVSEEDYYLIRARFEIARRSDEVFPVSRSVRIA